MLKSPFILIISVLALFTTTSFAEELKFSSAWVKAAPPTAKVLAAYLVADNPSKQSAKLTGFRSSQFKSIEMHETIVDAGLARMRAVTSIEIPASGRVEFKPGGLHLMLLDPIGVVKVGDKIELIAETQDKRQIKIEAVVKNATGGHDHSHHHHHH